MSRSNEELAVLIRSGATEYLPELWEQISGLVIWKANRILSALELRGSWGKCGIELGDLFHEGYPAMVNAVETYCQENGAFSTWFMFYLQKAFAELMGYRTKRQKCEPLNNSVSLNSPLSVSDEPNPGELADLVTDPQSTALMEHTDETIWRNQLHTALEAALSDLPNQMAEILRAKFWDGADRSEIAAAKGMTSEKVRSLEGQAIRTLRKPKHACKLIDYYEFDFYSGIGLTTFKHTGASIQERYLMIQEERRERANSRKA